MSDRTAAIRMEYDALKSDYDKLEKQNKNLDRKNKNYVKIIKKLKEEIEGWKKIYVDYAAGSAGALTFENFRQYLVDEQDEEDEENKSLTEQLEATRFMRQLAEENGRARREEITQLKDENEYLKRANKQMLKGEGRWIKEQQAEIIKQREEIQKLKGEEILVAPDCVWRPTPDTKNIKGNRKVVQTLYAPVSAEFKIPDGIDLEDKSVVEYWAVKYGTLRIKYVGKEKEEDIEWEYEPETDFKWGNDEIIDAEEANIEYEEDEEYMYDVKNDDTTYYLGDSLDEAQKHAQGRGLEIKRYIVEDGNTNFDNWDIVE